MTKQEQIREMAQITCGHCKNDICLIGNTLCDASCGWARQTKEIYNARYRKIDEVRKEAAKEILLELDLFLKGTTLRKGYEFKKINEKLKEIAEKYGVKVE